MKNNLANILRDIEFMCEGGTKEELNIAAYIQYARDGKSPNDIRAAISASAQPPQSENELHAIIRQLDTRCMEAELELSQAHRVIADLRAQLAAAQAERDQLKAGLQECRDAIAVALEAQSSTRDGYQDVIKEITAERDDLRMRLVKALELLGEVKTRLYGHVPLANAQHIDLFRRICALLDATEQQRGDAGEATK